MIRNTGVNHIKGNFPKGNFPQIAQIYAELTHAVPGGETLREVIYFPCRGNFFSIPKPARSDFAGLRRTAGVSGAGPSAGSPAAPLRDLREILQLFRANLA